MELTPMNSYGFVQTNQFTPAPTTENNAWTTIGNIAKWSYDPEEKSFLLTTKSSNSIQVKIYILGPSSFRVRFNPNSTDYSSNLSSAVVNRNLGSTNINYAQDNGSSTLVITLDGISISVGLEPYGIAVYRDRQLIHQTNYEYNLVYLPSGSEVTACFMSVAPGAGYYGLGEKAGVNLNNNYHTTTFFNYDNFEYSGSNSIDGSNYPVIPSNSQPGPLNILEPLYNSMPILVEWNPAPSGMFSGSPYANLIFLDNPCQTYFNIQATDYSQYMNGNYYFGSLYNEMDYYFITGNDIASVLNQFNILTGPSPMPPMYALGYHQGGYGYYNKHRLLDVAKSYRDNLIPIDGLHIDVDFQDNYRTFTSSTEKFGDATDLFNQLHSMGFKCSTNITGIMSTVPWDETAKTNDSDPGSSYPTAPYIVTALDESGNVVQRNVIDDGMAKNVFIWDKYIDSSGNDSPFITNENYGCNEGFNPYFSPGHVTNVAGCEGSQDIPLGTYGYYADLLRSEVKIWWSGNYYGLLDSGLDMIWQDMTCPAVVPSVDAVVNYKTLPGDLLMSNLAGELVPNAKIHNAYAVNMIQATYEGLTRIKNYLPDGHYNKNKRNFIIARGGYTGVHRYAASWTGDSASSWEFLSINIPQVLNWGMSGQPLSGCDIGGFANGNTPSGNIENPFSTDLQNPPYIIGGQPAPNLLTRWMTMGAFLPWYRNHYNGYTKAYQEPYNYSLYPHNNTTYSTDVMPACKKYIEIRYKLLQLFYDAMHECMQSNLPICRAMFINDPDDPNLHPLTNANEVLLSPYNPSQQFEYDTNNAYRIADQFFVGKDLLVAPVVLERWESSSYGPGNTTNDYPSRPVYLPQGFNWYDFNGNSTPLTIPNGPTTLQGALNQPTNGGQSVTWNTTQLDLVPVYIREGAIIPVRELEQYVGQLPKNYLTYNIYPGIDSNYLCYQDDHISMDAESKQAYRTIEIEHRHRNDISGQEISLIRQANNYTPPEEFYYIALLGQTQTPSSVNANKVDIPAQSTLLSLTSSPTNAYCYLPDSQTIFVKIFDTDASMTILLSGLKPIDESNDLQKSSKNYKSSLQSAVGAFLAFILSFSLWFYALPAQAESSAAVAPERDSLTSLVTPEIPVDITLNLEEEQKLLVENFPALQRLFDLFSWQSFIALNWPLDAQKNPQPKLTDPGIPQWLTFHESLQVFRPDGSAPVETTPRMCANNKSDMRELSTTSSLFTNTLDRKDIADEINQAFTSPLYDQNGKEVRYEVYLNDDEFDYLVENKLYNLDGQIVFSQNHQPVNFPSGDIDTGKSGAMEVKLAWKELDPKRDIPSRFFTQTVLLPKLNKSGEPILDSNGNFTNCQQQKVGLVGMHISAKTKSSPQWIWATFEQVDNLNTNDLVKVNGKTLQASFHDYSPAGQTLPVNVPPIPRDPKTGKPNSKGILKTQVSRPIPIPGAAMALNKSMQKILASMKSPLQYYELIDTQWPTAPYPENPGYPAIQGGPSPNNLPDAITRKSTGSPAPVYLTNSIMETYLQTGNQQAHFQENGFPFNNTPVFGTESCMACHFSAGIATGYVEKAENSDKAQKVAIFGGDLTADFSWLPQLKANWAQDSE
jgi:alpha-glucosidase